MTRRPVYIIAMRVETDRGTTSGYYRGRSGDIRAYHSWLKVKRKVWSLNFAATLGHASGTRVYYSIEERTGDKGQPVGAPTLFGRWRQRRRAAKLAHVRKHIVEYRDVARAIAAHCEHIALSLETVRDISDLSDDVVRDALALDAAAYTLNLPDEDAADA